MLSMKKQILNFLLIFIPVFLVVFLLLNFQSFSFLNPKKPPEREMPKEEISFEDAKKKEIPEPSPALKETSLLKEEKEGEEEIFPDKKDSLIIEKLKIEVPIILAVSKEKEDILKALQNGVALHPSFSKPGEKEVSIIYGHSSRPLRYSGNYNTVFATLNKLEVGDKIIVYFNHKKHIYIVKEETIFYPAEEEKFLPKESENSLLVLLTCWPPRTDLKRLAVIAELEN